MSYDGYSAVARVYDRLNRDIDYKKWADFFEECFDRFLDKKPEIILDLACGTGRMTRELACRGYDMIGVDGSYDMLGEAYSQGTEGILYLAQDMREFELYGTVGATVCCLDSLNYLLKEDELRKTFSLVHNYSDPDGLFIFDVNTPYKFEKVYADNSYILEDEDDEGGAVFCGWQNFYDTESRKCDFYLSVFTENKNGEYCREDEHQIERCYTERDIKEALAKTGFELLGVYSDFAFREREDNDERWYFVARAKK